MLRVLPSACDEAKDTRPKCRQVALRSLFGWTAYFALSSALAMRFGLGLFVLLNGVFLTWLSFRGYLWSIQSNSARPKVFGLAWILIAVSLGLPAFAVQGCSNNPPTVYAGWEAAYHTVLAVPGTWKEVRSEWEDPANRAGTLVLQFVVQWALVLLWNLPNLLILISPFLLYRQQRGKGDLLSALFCCAAFSSWTWGATAGLDLRIGYFVWSIGITAISLARAPGKRTLTSMATLGVLWLALTGWEKW